MLTDIFASARRSIIAFGSRALVVRKRVLKFPDIIGTGFIIDERGIVVTNRHVVRRLEKLPSHPKTGESAAIAVLCSEIESDDGEHSLRVVFVKIRRWDKLTTFESNERFYGEPLPDLAFVQINTQGLPALPLATDPGRWESGTPISTAGFPLGTSALAIYGQVNQIAPILRSGIIASVYPFPCPKPHGFTIDIMTLGGESGSPIFLTDTPTLVGLLHAGFNGTNITIAIPSWIVAKAFESYLHSVPLHTGLPSFDDLVAEGR